MAGVRTSGFYSCKTRVWEATAGRLPHVQGKPDVSSECKAWGRAWGQRRKKKWKRRREKENKCQA